MAESGRADPRDVEIKILTAQNEWLIDLLLKIGPPKVQEGVRYLWLREFLDEAMIRLRDKALFQDLKDDDIPF